jgi:putative ABC transport system permease protein
MYKLAMPVQPENPEIKPFRALGRVAYTDFFGMFEPPFRFGSPWGASEDASHARVIVLGKEINEKLFGGQDSVGKSVRLDGNDYRVVGVLGDWNLRFRYYDVTNGAFADPDEFFIPFTTAIDLKQRASGNNSCFSPAGMPISIRTACGSRCGCSWIPRMGWRSTSPSSTTTSTSRRSSVASSARSTTACST